MINLRNEGDFPIVMEVIGLLTTNGGNNATTIVRATTGIGTTQGSYGYSQYIPFNGIIKAVWAGERIPGSSSVATTADAFDLLYFPPISTTAGGVSSTTGISFVNPGGVFTTVMFNMATSTTGNSFYNQVPLITFDGNAASTVVQGGYASIFTSATQFNPPQVARGGYFCVVVRTVGSSPGSDINVVVELARQRQGAYSDVVQIGTYGADSDIY